MVKEILDIKILFGEESVFSLSDSLIEQKEKGYVCTINANLLTQAYKSESYKSILQNSAFNICDGSMLAGALSVKGTKVKSFPGPDFFLSRIKEKKFRSVFVGSDEKTLSKLRENLSVFDPAIHEMTFLELPFCDVKDFDYKSIADKVNKEEVDFIWVSLGAPKQEIFASYLCPHINSGLIVAVGAAFPFFAGTVKRAPNIVLNMNLEWLWRLFTEPKKTAKRLSSELYYMPKILLKGYFKSKAQ